MKPGNGGSAAPPPAGAGLRIAALAGRVRGLSGWRRPATAFVAGLLSVLALAPFFFSPVLLLTLPVLIWLIDGAGKAWPAAVAGWWFAFGYFAAGLFWVGEAFLVEAEIFAWLLPLAVTLLPAGLALFFAGAVAIAARCWMPGWKRVVVLGLALSLAEWLRGHVLTGFPWNVLGYALTWPLPLMQSAALIGIYGLTLATVLVFATPLVVLGDACDSGNARRRTRLALIAVGLPLAAAWSFGALRLAQAPPPVVDGVRLRLVQPSVRQSEKWRPENQARIFNDHIALSRQRPDGVRDDLAGITHVVWPEAAMPFQPLRSPEALAMIGEMLPAGVHLLSGGLRVGEEPGPVAAADRRFFNSLMVFGAEGRLAALYDKNHLVPFGEYLPLKPLLERIGLRQLTQMRGGFTPGPKPRPLLAVPGLPPVGVLVCYEAIFPAAIVQGAERPGLLVNVTNDGWFGNTTGPRQHLHQARVRAVEEGLPLVRVANNGISAMIDPKGRILQRIELNDRGVIDSVLPGALPPPPYARSGDGTFFGIWLLAALAVIAVRQRHSRKTV